MELDRSRRMQLQRRRPVHWVALAGDLDVIVILIAIGDGICIVLVALSRLRHMIIEKNIVCTLSSIDGATSERRLRRQS